MSVTEIYSSMWDVAQRDILEGRLDIDPWIGNAADTRYGMTLIARPSPAVADAVVTSIADIVQLEPGQYAYPTSDLHITVLSVNSCRSGFELDAVQTEAYAALIGSIVSDTPPITLHFRGLTASRSGLLVQGFPTDEALDVLRDRLRVAIGASGLEHSMDLRYTLKTAHMTALRFAAPLEHPTRFVRHVESMRDIEFGSTDINRIELVGNNWYMQQKRIRQLAEFSLT